MTGKARESAGSRAAKNGCGEIATRPRLRRSRHDAAFGDGSGPMGLGVSSDQFTAWQRLSPPGIQAPFGDQVLRSPNSGEP
ncbi:MAG: hypothetical protein KGS10_01570 [Chloroflexi bacterium]|nr:hypothetical protein [Chloroflexota bacterium]